MAHMAQTGDAIAAYQTSEYTVSGTIVRGPGRGDLAIDHADRYRYSTRHRCRHGTAFFTLEAPVITLVEVLPGGCAFGEFDCCR